MSASNVASGAISHCLRGWTARCVHRLELRPVPGLCEVRAFDEPTDRHFAVGRARLSIK